MAALANNRTADERIDADGPREHGFGAAGGASLALHAGVAAVLVWLTWATLREPAAEREAEVFLVVPAGEARAADPGAERALASEPEFLFVAPPSVRSWTPPSPPAREEARIEARAPTRTEPARDSSRTISYAEYQRRQGEASMSGRPSRANATASVATDGAGGRINVSRIRDDLGVGAASSAGISDGATGTEMQTYFDDLVGRLRASHKLPKGVDGPLQAEVQFTLAANGAVSDVRVLRSSGSKEFDQSVTDAFGRLKARARPDGKTEMHRLTFRVEG